MTVIDECPSLDDVASFLEGRADSTLSNQILEHLNTCTPCRLLLVNSLRATDATTPPGISCGTPQTFAIGETVDARYRIVRFISRGGMGEVYEAWDAQLQETIALKTIVCTSLDNAKLFSQFRAEVQLARRVTHTNVCRILEFGIHDREYRGHKESIPFFTMEYLNGETLAQVIARRERLSESDVLPLVLQAIDGLSAVHAAGIVHRDLKPDNVFILPGEAGKSRVVVMDFGLARSVTIPSSLVSSSGTSPVGTPAYMAPEQAVGGTPTTAWDVYALGVILFELLTGRLPFRANSAVALALARMHDRAPSLSSINPRVSPTFEMVVARCLERDPRRRYANLEEVRVALSGIVRGPIANKARRWVIFALSGVALLGLALVLFGAARGHFRNNFFGTPANARTVQSSPRAGMASGESVALDTTNNATDAQRSIPRGLASGQLENSTKETEPPPLTRPRLLVPTNSYRKVTDSVVNHRVSAPSVAAFPTSLQTSRAALTETPTPPLSSSLSHKPGDELAIPAFVRTQPRKYTGDHQ